MGDRAHVYAIQGHGGIYIRTQHRGTGLPLLVRETLRHMAIHKMFYFDMNEDHKGEFFDYFAFPAVFTRLAADCQANLKDLSIAWHVWDNEWPVLVVDPANLRLGTAPPPRDESDMRQPTPEDKDWVSFKWFITEATDKEITAWWEISREAWLRSK
jgi:hypothetical protein